MPSNLRRNILLEYHPTGTQSISWLLSPWLDDQRPGDLQPCAPEKPSRDEALGGVIREAAKHHRRAPGLLQNWEMLKFQGKVGQAGPALWVQARRLFIA